MNTLIIVDDQRESKASVAHWLAVEVSELTSGKYAAVTIEGVRISAALPLVQAAAARLACNKDMLCGLVIDLADRGQPKAGLSLVRAARADPDLSDVPMVIYTGKHMEIDYGEARQLDVKVVRRKATGGKGGDLGRQILAAFGIPHK